VTLQGRRSAAHTPVALLSFVFGQLNDASHSMNSGSKMWACRKTYCRGTDQLVLVESQVARMIELVVQPRRPQYRRSLTDVVR